ncbi:TIGR02206 family membrane protein [Candidatus Izimaplasma bacterium ZiA1]|uniref:YwaF family protein n=1 Tax=Candidatus Izimoplasma sp. ZiA1 TaxID=2024899 RepID=UPI000BAA935F|nr:TIGR02206 family membrane protein [Candidatus Izimaplasma bacterium ZiA1]
MTFARFFGHDKNINLAATMFSIHHLIYAATAVLTIYLTLKFAKMVHTSVHEKAYRIGFIVVLVFLELSYHIHNWTYPRFSVPLNICSFALFMSIYILATNDKKIFKFVFFFGTLGGILALFLPTTLGYTYYNFRYYHFWLVHSMLIVVPLYYYAGYEYRVTYKDLISVYSVVVLVTIPIYVFNFIFNTNYWFINEIPDNVSTFFPNFIVYIVIWYFTVFFSMNLLYFFTKQKPSA